MAYVRTHDTKQTSRGKVVKRCEVVYRAKVREHGQAVTRLRQETYTTREAAEARRDELNSHRHHAHATDPSEQRRRGARSLDEYAADRIAAQRIKVASGKLKERTLDEYAKLFDRYVSPELGHLPIAAITPAQLEKLIADLATGARRRGGGDLHPIRSNMRGTSPARSFVTLFGTMRSPRILLTGSTSRRIERRVIARVSSRTR